MILTREEELKALINEVANGNLLLGAGVGLVYLLKVQKQVE
jgi:hypothetical protein